MSSQNIVKFIERNHSPSLEGRRRDRRNNTKSRVTPFASVFSSLFFFPPSNRRVSATKRRLREMRDSIGAFSKRWRYLSQQVCMHACMYTRWKKCCTRRRFNFTRRAKLKTRGLNGDTRVIYDSPRSTKLASILRGALCQKNRRSLPLGFLGPSCKSLHSPPIKRTLITMDGNDDRRMVSSFKKSFVNFPGISRDRVVDIRQRVYDNTYVDNGSE